MAAEADAVVCIVAHRYGYVPPVELGGDGALLGMEFIRSLDKLLLVGKVVALVDHTMVPGLADLG